MQITTDDDFRRIKEVGIATFEISGWGGSIRLNSVTDSSVHFKFSSPEEMLNFLVGAKLALDSWIYKNDEPIEHSAEEIEKMKVFFGNLYVPEEEKEEEDNE